MQLQARCRAAALAASVPLRVRAVAALAVPALLGLGAVAPAQAQGLQIDWKSGWVVKGGVTRYAPDSRTDGIRGIGIPPGADAKVGDATTAIFIVEKTLTDNLSAEFVIGVPPRIEARATGSVAFLGENVLSAKNVAPTFFVNWTFGDPAQRLRPYIGLGVNYTRFASAKSKLAPDVELSDSVGAAVNAGLSYRLDDRMGLFASIARIDVKSDLVAVSSTVLQTRIDFRPTTYSLGVWYRF